MFHADSNFLSGLLMGNIPSLLSWMPSFLLLLLIVGVLVAKSVGRRPKATKATHGSKLLLSSWEASVFHLLERQLTSSQRLCPQVAVSALVTVDAESRSNRTTWSNKIARWSVDFVVLDLATNSPVLVIELDDRTHERPDRRRRDAHLCNILAEAGIPLARFRPGQPIEIRNALQQQGLASMANRKGMNSRGAAVA